PRARPLVSAVHLRRRASSPPRPRLPIRRLRCKLPPAQPLAPLRLPIAPPIRLPASRAPRASRSTLPISSSPPHRRRRPSLPATLPLLRSQLRRKAARRTICQSSCPAPDCPPLRPAALTLQP